MRGDASLFADGMKEIASRTGWAPLGLVPFFDGARRLPAEDAYDLTAISRPRGNGSIKVVVPHLPHIANFDDLDPLASDAAIDLIMVERGRPLPDCDLMVLPGSKATIADLGTLRSEGWDGDLAAHVRHGGRVLGLCGGYQMLGKSIADPDGIEGKPGAVAGLGLLDVETIITGEKTLEEVEGFTVRDGVKVRGYEMHMGRTTGPGTTSPLIRFSNGTADGAISSDGRVAGTYLHGFFNDDAQRAAWIERLGGSASELGHDAQVEAALDSLAEHLEAHIEIDALLKLAR
jgi:adenosylcobyric acid synthase